MSNKKSKGAFAPKLRFPEFQDLKEWQERKLSDFASLINERAGENKHILMSVTVGVGLLTQTEKFGREIAGNSYKNYIVIKNFDFAYNKSATKQYPEGYIAMYTGQDSAAVPNSIFTCFRIEDDDVNPYFLNHIFSANFHGAWLRQFITIGARAHGALNVDTDDLMKMPIKIPSPKEQQKIADCLTSLDELIEAERAQLDALKDYKKGLLQNIFPAEGEAVPVLRFPEFQSADEWEETQLESVCDLQAGQFVSASGRSDQYNNGLYPCYGGNGLRGYVSTFTHSGEYPLIGRQGALCGNVTFGVGQFHATEHAVVATAKNNIDAKWLFYALVVLNLNQYAVGQAQPGLSVTVLEKVDIAVPTNIKEQQKIAEFLMSIDDEIAEQGQRVAALQVHKKGLMQGLFPSAGEVEE